MTTEAFSLRGYWRTDNERHAWMPAMTITRLTTIARTGLRMNRSVKEEVFMEGRADESEAAAGSGVLRFRRDLGIEREGVVDHDVRAGAQLEDAGGHDHIAGLQAVDDAHQVTPPSPPADELLAEHLRRLAALFVLLLGDDENGIAIGGKI